MSSPEGPADPSERPSRRRRWRRRLVALTLVAVALAVGLRVLLPIALERGIPYAVQRYVGLPAAVRNIDFWLLRGAVAVEGVAVGKAAPPGAGTRPEGESPSLVSALLHPAAVDPATALARWERVYVHLDWGALLHHRVHLLELSIDAPAVDLQRQADGRIDPLAGTKLANPPSAAAEPEKPAEAAQPKKPGEPWSYAVDRFELRKPSVKIDDPSGASLLEFALDDFSLSDVAFGGNKFSLGSLGIQGPDLRVRRDLVLGGDSKPSGPPPPAQPAKPASASKPPDYRVERIGIERAEFTLVTDAGPFDVALALEASDVTAAEGARFPLKLQLEIEKGTIEVDGQVGIVPPRYDGHVGWKDLPFAPILLASRPEMRSWLRSCHAHGDLTVHFSLAPENAGVELAGDIGIDSFSVADPEQREVGLDFQSFETVVRKAQIPIPAPGKPPGPRVVVIDSVKLVDPKIHYARPTPQLDKLLGGSGGAPPAHAAEPAAAPAPQPAAAGASPPLDLAVGSIDVSGASLAFEDGAGPSPRRGGVDGLRVGVHDLHVRSGAAPLAVTASSFDLGSSAIRFEDDAVKPPYRGGVKDLSVAARSLSFPELAASDVSVHGTAPDGGAFKVKGSFKGGNGDFAIQLDRLALPPFNPYASSAAGYSLAGAASLQSKIQIRGPRYDTRNQITLHKLGVTAQKQGDFEARFGIPLDVALALLRDPSGDISLSVPVGYGEKGVSTGVGTIVASALRQALLGALSSPLKMIGAVLPGGDKGGGEVSLEPLGFVAGGAAFAPGQEERLGGLAQLLASRPALKLALSGRTGPDDRPGVAEQMLVDRAGGGEALPSLEGASFFARRRVFAALEKRARGETAELAPDDQALLARYVAQQQVPPERMAALARQRAEKVRDTLVSQRGVDAARLQVGVDADAGGPAVVVGFAAP